MLRPRAQRMEFVAVTHPIFWCTEGDFKVYFKPRSKYGRSLESWTSRTFGCGMLHLYVSSRRAPYHPHTFRIAIRIQQAQQPDCHHRQQDSTSWTILAYTLCTGSTANILVDRVLDVRDFVGPISSSAQAGSAHARR